jgi:tetratricopeptide (TPR) repeat protein
VNSILVGFLATLLATNAPVAISNWVKRTPGESLSAVNSNDPREIELSRIMSEDDAAQSEVERWIKDNEAFKAQGTGISDAALALKIEQRLALVRTTYTEFLKKNPQHSRARIAYGSFLNDIGEETQARDEWIKARDADPKNPAAWNNLANYYGHQGPITNAFVHYAKAIELSPREPVYYRNFATTLFLFRRDAKEFLNLDEQQVFDRSLELYRLALKLEPGNFIYASDLAQTYYGIKPYRPAEALAAWELAMTLTHDSMEQEGVYLHMARWEIIRGRWEAAGQYLGRVTNSMYMDLKKRISRNLEEKSKAASATNAPNAVSAPP